MRSVWRPLDQGGRPWELDDGSIGYSATRHDDRRKARVADDGLALSPPDVTEVYSSYFSDTSRLPVVSVDCDELNGEDERAPGGGE